MVDWGGSYHVAQLLRHTRSVVRVDMLGTEATRHSVSFASLHDDLPRCPLYTAVASKCSLGRSLASARVGGPEDAGDQIIHAVVVPWRWDEPDPRVSPSPGHT